MPSTTDSQAASPALSRRERQRQATHDEIVGTARTLLRSGQDVSLRAVAEEMGLTPPALYRYVDSLATLNDLVTQQILTDVVATMTQARDHYPAEDPPSQIVASATAFRLWALANPAEFRAVFASPGSPDAAPQASAGTFAAVVGADCHLGESPFIDFFGEMFFRLWDVRRFTVPSRDELDPGLVALWETDGSGWCAFAARFGEDGLGVLWLFEMAWARLYGIIALEVFGHIEPALTSTGALYRAILLEIGVSLGLEGEWGRLRSIADTAP